MKKHHKYPEIIIRHNDEGSPIRVLHPLDQLRSQMFVKHTTGDHKNYWRIANSQYGNLILIIPRNAFWRRGKYYISPELKQAAHNARNGITHDLKSFPKNRAINILWNKRYNEKNSNN